MNNKKSMEISFMVKLFLTIAIVLFVLGVVILKTSGNLDLFGWI